MKEHFEFEVLWLALPQRTCDYNKEPFMARNCLDLKNNVVSILQLYNYNCIPECGLL